MTTRDKADLLEQLSSYDGCETGDFWNGLVSMYCYSKDYMSEEFWLQMGLEIEIQFEEAVEWIMEGDMEVDDEDLMKKITDYLKEE
jgi:hypothetical protein